MNQVFNDELIDNLIGINTVGRDDSTSDDNHAPYEATAYAVLDRIVDEGYISGTNTLVDLGCGKGRVPIYVSGKCGCKAMGIDMEKRFIEVALDNLQRTKLSDLVCFFQGMAECVEISEPMDRFFFFNPFSYDIFSRVLSNIENSYYENPRDILMIFYYPSDEYMGRLMTEDSLMFVDEIDCRDLFKLSDEREKVVIFKLV